MIVSSGGSKTLSLSRNSFILMHCLSKMFEASWIGAQPSLGNLASTTGFINILELASSLNQTRLKVRPLQLDSIVTNGVIHTVQL